MANVEEAQVIEERTVEVIKAEIEEISKKAEKLALEIQFREYGINIENKRNLQRLINYVENNAAWSHQDAAGLIALHANLKEAEVKGLDEDGNLKLRSINLNTLYNVFLKSSGKGLKSAKDHISLLTIVGESVSNSMQTMADDNQELRDIHQELSKLDDELQLNTSSES